MVRTLFGAIIGLYLFTYTPGAVAQDKKSASYHLLASNSISIVPDRDIQYEGEHAPDWKMIWDQARELSRQKKYKEALVQYELLFGQKDNIDEARWEYTSISLLLNRVKQAQTQLDILLFHDPDNKKYIRAQAAVSYASHNFLHAAELYQKLYDEYEPEKDKVQILEGLVASYQSLEEWEKVLQFIEELLLLKPAQRELLIQAIKVGLQLQQHQKVEAFLTRLETFESQDTIFLQLKSQLADQMGNDEKAAVYWQQIIAIDPDNGKVHKQLAKYYQRHSNVAMELKHVELLLKNNPGDALLIERAADLNLRLKRADRALDLYHYYLVILPSKDEVVRKKKLAQRALAKELLVLVDNNQGRTLWKDLLKVTNDRLGVYVAMASLLRENGNVKSLADVLIIIYEENPDDVEVGKELALLLQEQGRTDELEKILSLQNTYVIPTPTVENFPLKSATEVSELEN